MSVYAVWAPPPDALQCCGEMLASEFYVANWWFIFRDVGYFNQFRVAGAAPLVAGHRGAVLI
ncbi:MAG: hypothetical protein R2690_14900 [Acidimicrobiales bacterium]